MIVIALVAFSPMIVTVEITPVIKITLKTVIAFPMNIIS
jgi:hypothetical protein